MLTAYKNMVFLGYSLEVVMVWPAADFQIRFLPAALLYIPILVKDHKIYVIFFSFAAEFFSA